MAVTLQEADLEYTTTIQTTLPEAIEQLEAVAAVIDDKVKSGEALVTDKGYHSKQIVLEMQNAGLRSYMSEPDRGKLNIGSISTLSATRCMLIGDAFAGERGQQRVRLREGGSC